MSGRVYQPHHDSVMAFSPQKKALAPKEQLAVIAKKLQKYSFPLPLLRKLIFFPFLASFIIIVDFVLFFLFANWRPVHFSQLIVFLPCLYVITITGMRT